jgi:hypothetical protein
MLGGTALEDKKKIQNFSYFACSCVRQQGGGERQHWSVAIALSRGSLRPQKSFFTFIFVKSQRLNLCVCG